MGKGKNDLWLMTATATLHTLYWHVKFWSSLNWKSDQGEARKKSVLQTFWFVMYITSWNYLSACYFRWGNVILYYIPTKTRSLWMFVQQWNLINSSRSNFFLTMLKYFHLLMTNEWRVQICSIRLEHGIFETISYQQKIAVNNFIHSVYLI